MRGFLRRLLGAGRNFGPPGGGPSYYRAASYTPLRPWQVRERRFTPAGLHRRGVDAAEVSEFLERVATDLAMVYAELARSQEQNVRIKDALRTWQSRQATLAHELAGRR